MNKKDLAEEYAIKEYERLNDSEPIFEDNLCFSIIDIEAAFNAGRESVVENIPELEWETLKDGSLKASTPFGCYNIDKDNYGISHYIVSSMFSKTKVVFGKQNAILAADENYKKRIKQALKL